MAFESNSKIETIVRELLCHGESVSSSEKILNIHKMSMVDRGNKHRKIYNTECLVYLFSLNEILDEIIVRIKLSKKSLTILQKWKNLKLKYTNDNEKNA